MMRNKKRPADFYKELDDINACLILINSDPKNHDSDDNFFDDLYEDYRINRIKSNGMIKCNAGKKGREMIFKFFSFTAGKVSGLYSRADVLQVQASPHQ